MQQSGIRFFLLGVLSFFLTLGLTAFFHEMVALPEEGAYFCAILVVFLVNFSGARYFVFNADGKPIVKQFLQFVVSSLFFRGGEFLAFLLLHSLLGMYYLLATVIVMTVSFIGKFMFYRSRVFNHE